MGKKRNTIPKPYLPAMTMLGDRRYRVEKLMSDNDLVVAYLGYDTFRKKQVVIRELFPKSIVWRNPDKDDVMECKKMIDEQLFISMKEHQMRRVKKLISLYPITGITNAITCFEENETVYAIEEYIEGTSLKELLFKRHSAKFTVEDMMKYLSPAMDILEKLHGKGIYHGAITPENILYDKAGKCFLTDLLNPMEDVAAENLGSPSIRKDAYSPVELYLPKAKMSAATDIYEIGAILYQYVTGTVMPAYFERINEDKETLQPVNTMSRVMEFQSDAIMKSVSIYDFNRYQSFAQLKEALTPSDIDVQELYSSEEVGRTISKKPFWYAYEEKMKRQYFAIMAVALLVLFVGLGPKLWGVAQDLRINHFYAKFNGASDLERCQMVTSLDKKQRALYTNDYFDLDMKISDEELSKSMVPKYYDFQLKKYVTFNKVDMNRTVYEYMKIDYRKSEVIITYNSDKGNRSQNIKLRKDVDGAYVVQTIETDKNGNTTTETQKVFEK